MIQQVVLKQALASAEGDARVVRHLPHLLELAKGYRERDVHQEHHSLRDGCKRQPWGPATPYTPAREPTPTNMEELKHAIQCNSVFFKKERKVSVAQRMNTNPPARIKTKTVNVREEEEEE